MNKLLGHELGSEGYNRVIDFMRADLAKSFVITPQLIELRAKLEATVRERLRAEGRDFDAELEKWKEAKKANEAPHNESG